MKGGHGFVPPVRGFRSPNYTLSLTVSSRQSVGGPWGSRAGQVRPRTKRRRPSRSAHTLVYAREATVGSGLCPRPVCAPSSRSRRSLRWRRRTAARRLPGGARGCRDPRVPEAPPRSSRHVPPRRPISVRSAQARDSNCGAAGSLGSALGRPPPPPLRTGHGAPHRGARSVPGHQAGEWRCQGLGDAAVPAICKVGGARVWRPDPFRPGRPFSGRCSKKGLPGLELGTSWVGAASFPRHWPGSRQ